MGKVQMVSYSLLNQKIKASQRERERERERERDGQRQGERGERPNMDVLVDLWLPITNYYSLYIISIHIIWTPTMVHLAPVDWEGTNEKHAHTLYV